MCLSCLLVAVSPIRACERGKLLRTDYLSDYLSALACMRAQFVFVVFPCCARVQLQVQRFLQSVPANAASYCALIICLRVCACVHNLCLSCMRAQFVFVVAVCYKSMFFIRRLANGKTKALSTVQT